MIWEGARKDPQTSHGAGIQTHAVFGGRVSAWGVCGAQRFGPSLDRRTREKRKLLTATVRIPAAGSAGVLHRLSLSGAGDLTRNGLPI